MTTNSSMGKGIFGNFLFEKYSKEKAKNAIETHRQIAEWYSKMESEIENSLYTSGSRKEIIPIT